MRKLPLHNEHTALGAHVIEQAGWQIPADYGDLVKEHQAVQETVALFDLSYRGKIQITGRDRVKFLQGILTQEISKVPIGQGTYAALLTLKGKMISDMRVLVSEDKVLIDTEGGIEKTVMETLSHYAKLSNVTLEDITESYGLLSLQGPKAKALLEAWTGDDLTWSEEFSHRERMIQSIPLRMTQSSRSFHGGYDLLVLQEHLTTLWRLCMSFRDALHRGSQGIQAAGWTTLETLRIERGIPRFCSDMDEDTFPLEAGILNAISFEKGCYLGQEPVARMHFRGHPNRHLVGFELNGELIPSHGDKVFKDEKEIGKITSAAISRKEQKPIALGYVRREHYVAGEAVHIDVQGSKIPAKVQILPTLK